jgi:hypothetical protein
MKPPLLRILFCFIGLGAFTSENDLSKSENSGRQRESRLFGADRSLLHSFFLSQLNPFSDIKRKDVGAKYARNSCPSQACRERCKHFRIL